MNASEREQMKDLKFALVTMTIAFVIGIFGYTNVVRDRDRLEREIRANKQAATTETHDGTVMLPSCPEDTVLVGTGKYENGRWTSYVCGGAADDYRWHE